MAWQTSEQGMARYFFHLWTGSAYELDEVGLDLATSEEAYLEAFKAAQEIWGEMVHARADPSAYRFTVLEAEGRVLLDLPFVETFKALPNPGRPQRVEQLIGRQRMLAGDLMREIALAKDALERSKKS